MLLLSSVFVLSFGAIAHSTSRIVGGHDAPKHKYPYQVSLRDNQQGHFCSGSILNSHWILTAAHCFELRRDPKSIKVAAGTNYLSEKGATYFVQFYIMHEGYKSFYHDDIALVRVVGEIAFNNFVKTITLPDGDFNDYSVPALVAGWGSRLLGGSASIALQEIELKVLTHHQCRARKSSVTPNHICTLTKINEGLCHGDSGGPLVVNGVQIGIASYVTPCAVGLPDVYTRVSSYVDWIGDTMDRFAIVFE